MEKEINEFKVFKVAKRTNPHLLAEAICGAKKEKTPVRLKAVGAYPTNQALKAICYARQLMPFAIFDIRPFLFKEDGSDVMCIEII